MILAMTSMNQSSASRSLHMLVRAVISNKKQEEIPYIVESMLNKVMEEFERRLVSQQELMKATAKDLVASSPGMSLETTSSDIKMEEETSTPIKAAEASSGITAEEYCSQEDDHHDEKSKIQLLKQQMMVEQQHKHIQELKHALHSTKTGMQFLKIKYQEEFNILGKHLYGLAHAASGYQRVLEENRKLYNQVQDLKGNIRVYCRVRPFLPGQPNRFSTVDHIEEGNITIITPSKYGKEEENHLISTKFLVPRQLKEVFADTQPLIRSVLDGYNVCIFAYGQTGSGKTYTMSGPDELTEESQGVNYRALSDLFLLSDQRKEIICYEISVQMLEIYNEQVRDLLASDEIRNSSQNGINVPDATQLPVSSTADVINLMNLGHRNRAVSATAMNDRSSRSHSCLTVHVQGRNFTSGTVIRGSMHLVDLAGSERVDKSEVTGDRLKEAQHINKSLSALGDVISSLAQKSSHVPYRNSKLTQLLQDSLGTRAGQNAHVCHISPEHEALGETISTLKFAERVATVELGAARVNKDSSEVKELKEQIANLKAALVRKEGDSEHSQNSGCSTPERLRMKPGTGDSSRRQSMDNAGNIEVRSNSSSSLRRRSLDLNDLRTKSPPWPPVGSPAQNENEEDKESASGDWVDKVMVNRHDNIKSGDEENLLGQWELDSRQLPEPFYQGYAQDPSKIYPEQPFNNKTSTANNKDNQEFDAQSRRSDVISTDSDELEAGTSDSSEPDLLWKSNLPRESSLPNGLGSKPKKTNTKAIKRPETKSLIPSLIPSPSKKRNGVSPVTSKLGRHLVAADVKRKTGHAKNGVALDHFSSMLDLLRPLHVSTAEVKTMESPLVPLGTLIGRELRNEKVEKPFVKYGQAALAKKGEDYFLIKPDCQRIPGDMSTSFSVFAIFDGHNGISAAIFAKENLLDNVLSAIPQEISQEEWLQALPRALVAGFVKTDIEFQQKRETSGTTVTFVVIDGWTVTVASVGDSRCILDTQGGVVSLLTVDHRLEENAEERERVTASGGEVGRLNVFGGNQVGPLRCWPGGLCLSRSIGDTDVGEFIVPIPHVKQVKLSSAGGRLIIASDGIWDALSSDMAAKSCRGLPAELAAKLVVKEALRSRGLKDDTTCLVVDIIPSDVPVLPSIPRKKQNLLSSLLFGKKYINFVSKATNKLSAVGVVEELFEEGSARLAERLGKDFPSNTNSGLYRCAVCQVDQTPTDGLSVNTGSFFSPGSKPWEGPFLCPNCRKKKDAMEGKRPSRPTVTA
ncbi:hypothetical protein GH714_026108 [Hevea brasiliensis]|uniref:protein-serine/threonine phosphatase n=1 Tax=Hevea brasiliensis TaxID=3981 RepID=A0A6A6M397_HEVBR|nr:hypothetical protein GH714_026108 [Hevea brasiliensis]